MVSKRHGNRCFAGPAQHEISYGNNGHRHAVGQGDFLMDPCTELIEPTHWLHEGSKNVGGFIPKFRWFKRHQVCSCYSSMQNRIGQGQRCQLWSGKVFGLALSFPSLRDRRPLQSINTLITTVPSEPRDDEKY